MTPRSFAFVVFVLIASACEAADIGVVTIADDGGRVLRGITWLKIAEGMRVQEGDVVEASERAQLQVEMGEARIVSLIGPGSVYFASGASPATAAELALTRGWLKAAAPKARAPLRIRTSGAQVDVADGIVVVHADGVVDVFVESGSARMTDASAAKPTDWRNASAGEFWSRENGKPLASTARPTAVFVSSLPRPFMDPLPARVSRFAAAHVEPAPAGDVTYAEAEPWLAGPYRAAFVKRLRPRLKDAAFRHAVDAHIAQYPEWDRILHPEKYQPKKPALPAATVAPKESRR